MGASAGCPVSGTIQPVEPLPLVGLDVAVEKCFLFCVAEFAECCDFSPELIVGS